MYTYIYNVRGGGTEGAEEDFEVLLCLDRVRHPHLRERGLLERERVLLEAGREREVEKGGVRGRGKAREVHHAQLLAK